MKNILPLYHREDSTLCSRTARFLTGLFFFCSLLVLALEVPSLLYYFFYFINFLFILARDFYRSETGQVIFKCTKLFIFIYNEYSYIRIKGTKWIIMKEINSIINLKKRMGRGDIMIPPLFIWIFQDYQVEASDIFGKINPIIVILLNTIYNKISNYLLDSVSITNNFL